jgi:hypothetical protein
MNMSDKVLAFDIGLRKETGSKFTGPDYSVDSKPVAIDGNNLCGGTPNSTKAGGTGESLGMSTQKPKMHKLIVSEMGTVKMTKD